MKICKYQAASMREAVAQVRRELGPDAMVVATRQVRRGLLGTGVEVTAAIDIDEPNDGDGNQQGQAPRAAQGLSETDVERIMAPLRSELRSLRSLLRPLATAVPDEEIKNELHAMRQALVGLRRDTQVVVPTGTGDIATLAARTTLVAPSEKRVVGLVGPTGVGKTTTIAKLAARAALVEHRSVAILTLDTYRVGGEEQIRAFADLMGVPLKLVTDPSQLGAVIKEMGRFDRIFIDTAGRSPRDSEAIAVLERAFGNVTELELHLVLPASSPPSLIDECMRRYRALGIDRLLFTKIDEAQELCELVRAPARLTRAVTWITNGQRVPEDLEEATPERLVDLALHGFAAPAQGEVAA